MEVADIIKLMEGMAKSRIALLECEGLKLASSPPDRGNQPAAASGLMPANMPVSPHPVETDPVKAIHAAKEAQQKLVEQRLAISQLQTTAARKRAAKGGIGPRDTGALVKDIFDTSKKSARVKPRS